MSLRQKGTFKHSLLKFEGVDGYSNFPCALPVLVFLQCSKFKIQFLSRFVAQPVKSEYRSSGFIKEIQCKGVNWFQSAQDMIYILKNAVTLISKIFPFLTKLFGCCVHRSLATVSTPEGKHVVSIETLRERNLPPALDNFLFNLAVAENMMML
jgi:hypothetical protein